MAPAEGKLMAGESNPRAAEDSLDEGHGFSRAAMGWADEGFSP